MLKVYFFYDPILYSIKYFEAYTTSNVRLCLIWGRKKGWKQKGERKEKWEDVKFFFDQSIEKNLD